MARAKKETALTPEERLQAALVPDWEWPYKLPKNWCWVRLYSLAHIISKGTTPKGGKDAYVEKGIRFLRIENINEDGSISHENIKHITEAMHTGFLRRSILCKDDILISIAGTLGKTGIVGEADLPLNTNQAISFVRLIRGNLLPQYIKMSIDNPKTQDMLISQTKVTSIPNLTLEIIGNCAIPLAPLAEQQRIVDRIESLFAKLDEAKEKAQAVVDSFETRKAAILHVPSFINLWGVNTEIKIITAWRVSVDPKCLNKLGRILNMRLQLSSKYGEYDALMRFLTETGMDFLEMIDLREIHFSHLLESVYNKTNTSYFKDVLQQLRDNYSTGSTRFGRYTVRYLLLNLREDLLERVMPSQFSPQWKCKDLYLSRKCFPFECNPLASDLADSKTSQISQAKYLARVVEKEKTEIAVPYWSIVKSMQDTGEIYCNLGGDLTEQAIQKYNDCLDDWERQKGYEIISDGNVACIAAYEASTLFILNKLLELSQLPNKGQKEVNERYLRDCNIAFSDPKKEETLKYAFVNSRVLLIYGAAGTGKTTLIDMISTMLSGRRKLFLTKTHTALQNLQRRINNPGADASFVSINSFTKRVNLPDYDVIFVDECSTIDNRAMKVFLEKMRPDTFLVLAGDTYQIESIDFGNWFTYAKDIIKTKGSNVELVSTWRTKDPGLIELWNETRNKGALITEKLVIDGPFSENIGEGVFNSEIMDEVILCLNYDGKFGLNNMNSYFQNANTEKAVVWRDWKYKVGDHILFNDTDRFSLLYNNLKGRIVQIELFDRRIRFTVDVEIPLTEQDCQNDGIEFIDIIDDVTRIRIDVLDFEEEMTDEDRKKTVVPFQLAYAVSIHKAQGLEYRSVKVVIPSSNAEKITHGIFYTAITRAKEELKIYWSSETMQEVVAGFSVDTSRQKSLAIIKEKLKQNKNT